MPGKRLLIPLCFPLLLACATAPPPAPPAPEWSDATRAAAGVLASHLDALAVEPGTLVVRLAFEPGADLDLYVTDPRLETVYYANTPIVSGGRLEVDRRCEADEEGAVRVEEVRFDAPLPGRYRVGVDFPHRCEGGPDEVPYVVSIEDRGTRSQRRGMARWLEFTTIVHEFEVE